MKVICQVKQLLSTTFDEAVQRVLHQLQVVHLFLDLENPQEVRDGKVSSEEQSRQKTSSFFKQSIVFGHLKLLIEELGFSVPEHGSLMLRSHQPWCSLPLKSLCERLHVHSSLCKFSSLFSSMQKQAAIELMLKSVELKTIVDLHIVVTLRLAT